MNNRLLLLCSRPSTLNIKSRSARAFNAAAAVDASRGFDFPRFSAVSEICEYAENHGAAMDGQTLAKFLRFSNGLARTLPDGSEWRDSPAIKQIVSAAVGKFQSQDSNISTNLLRELAELCPWYKSNSPVPEYLKDAGTTFRNLVASKKLSLSAADFVTALKSLCRLEGKDSELCSLVEKNIPKYISQMTSKDCRMMIEVLNALEMRQPELYKTLSNKLIGDLDQFKNTDVIGSLITFSDTGFIVAPVVKRCTELLVQHPSLFDVEELIRAAEALIQLDRFAKFVQFPIVEEIQKKVRSLRVKELCRTLDILGSIAGTRHSAFADEILGLLASSPAPKSIAEEVSMAHAICSFNLQSRKPLLQTLIGNFSLLEQPTPHFLLKIIEIFESAKFDMEMRVELPKPLQSHVEQLHANRKIDGFNLVVKELADKLPEKYKLSVETGLRVGPFIPSLVDTKNKVVIEVLIRSFPFRLRQHLYEKLGFSSVFIRFGRLRQAKEEVAKIEVLQYALDPVMVKLGRMSTEEVNARFNARRDSFQRHAS